jgi:hypothetical protein
LSDWNRIALVAIDHHLRTMPIRLAIQRFPGRGLSGAVEQERMGPSTLEED